MQITPAAVSYPRVYRVGTSSKACNMDKEWVTGSIWHMNKVLLLDPRAFWNRWKEKESLLARPLNSE